MSSWSWTFVEGDDIKLPRMASERDEDLDAPLADLVEKQRRLSRSSQPDHDQPPADSSNNNNKAYIFLITIAVTVTLAVVFFFA